MRVGDPNIDRDLDRHIEGLGNQPEPPEVVCNHCKASYEDGVELDSVEQQFYDEAVADATDDETEVVPGVVRTDECPACGDYYSDLDTDLRIDQMKEGRLL